MATVTPRPDSQSRRGPAYSRTVSSVLGAVAVGAVVTWWITVTQRVPVQADGDLASVRFGFPLLWIVQDHSSNPFVSYPNEVVLRLTGRTGIDYPTEYEWVPFVGDILIWGAVFWMVAMVGVPLLVRVLRRNGRTSKTEADG